MAQTSHILSFRSGEKKLYAKLFNFFLQTFYRVLGKSHIQMKKGLRETQQEIWPLCIICVKPICKICTILQEIWWVFFFIFLDNILVTLIWQFIFKNGYFNWFWKLHSHLPKLKCQLLCSKLASFWTCFWLIQTKNTSTWKVKSQAWDLTAGQKI